MKAHMMHMDRTLTYSTHHSPTPPIIVKATPVLSSLKPIPCRPRSDDKNSCHAVKHSRLSPLA